ncbi:hypothetical protein B296_00030484 [Ensete ventricosum]|uniref:Uncharacterized protein n=1 Tax=Ensete ventricosum TaxID=4639 RepID=A0A427AIZ0_ENSVE|nr:hypothetical protein B296_00030484 [Ensete ventricosum]
MKSCHDIASVISEEALESIQECYSIPEGYVSDVPTNNKGWKAQYFFVSGPSWGFKVNWSIHPISNVPHLLSEEESIMVNRLRGILPLSRAIRDMIEKWLVEAGLSPASRGIPAL